MKKTIFIFLLTGCCLLPAPILNAQSESALQPDTLVIRQALELIGLDFSNEEIRMMQRGTIANKQSYQLLRDIGIPNDWSPALYFDPRPPGYKMPALDDSPELPWPVSITLPDSEAGIAFLNIPQLAGLIKNRKISSVQLTEIYLDRLRKYNDSLLCVVTLTEERALAQARKADAEIAAGHYKGLLHGIPFGVKDLMAVKGYPTTWGAMPYKDQMIDVTATVVEKLEDAGAVLVAKLTTGALAMGDVWFGGTTRNPWNPEQGSSGSSAGPAAATAAGLVAFAIGTETLGSIVSPSTRCGVTGLRPTPGRVSKFGTMALSWSMDKIGPICRSAEDCAIVFDAIRGLDDRDHSTVEAGFNYRPLKDLSQLRIAYLNDLFNEKYAYRSNDSAALEVFQKLGAKLIPAKLPSNIPAGALRIILNAEAAAAFDELTLSNRDTLLVSQRPYSWPNTFRTARLIPAVEYIQANRARTELIRQINEWMSQFDVVIAPSFGGDQLTITNLTGHPALLVPNGFDEKGAPTSITLIGNLFQEGILCAVGKLYQNETGFFKQHPERFK